MRFLLTTRPSPHILVLFGKPLLDLSAGSRGVADDSDDVAAYVYGRLEKMKQRSYRVDLAFYLAEASHGNFLFASTTLQSILEGE